MASQHLNRKFWILGMIVLIGIGFALALPALARAQQSGWWEAVSAPAAKKVVYVAKTGDGSDGSTWDHAYTDLQAALGVAESGYDIWVATGIYTPGKTVSDTFQLVDGVGIYGGFDPANGIDLFEERDWDAFPTVLSGDIEGDDTTDKHGVVITTTDIAGYNSFHVVTGSGMTSTAVLDGFTITAGQADGSVVDPCDDQCGGGMYNHSGSPTLVNVNFSGNSAASGGGGMYNHTYSSSVLDNVTFSGNSADSGGGGIFNIGSSNPSLTDVTFTGNAATWGGGMRNVSSSPSLMQVAFSDNSADWGGGIENNSNSNPTLITVTFTGNSADWGGGIYNLESSPALTIVTFSGNSAGWGGGMFNVVCSPTLTNATFISNTASEDGGGMYNNGSHLLLTEVTFSNNSATVNGGGMTNIKNSSPTLNYVTFISNTADVGGGMYNFDSSDPLIKFSTFFSNSSSSGGGMSNWESNPTLINVTLSGNWSDDEGGGMSNFDSNPQMIGVSFSGNSAASLGGGIFNDNSSLTLTNVTFSGNSATSWYGGGIYNGSSSVSLRNSILWNNQDSSGTGTISATVYNGSSAVTLTHSLAQGTGGSDSWISDPSYVDAGENLDADPLFRQVVDASTTPTTTGDLRLDTESPAIDQGADQYVTGVTTDLDGEPRISGSRVDMGAYEFQFYPLGVTLAGTGSGLVSGKGISCGTDCTEIYADMTVITLTAAADTGSTFAGWSGACTNTAGDCVVKMTEFKVVTATFTLDQYTLSLSLLGTGSGEVTSDPAGIACTPSVASDCSETYDYGTLVTLTATADPGSTFTGWGDACTDIFECVLTITEPFSVTAKFNSLDVYLPLVSR
jgi:predicted outer membrane repeat protein